MSGYNKPLGIVIACDECSGKLTVTGRGSNWVKRSCQSCDKNFVKIEDPRKVR